MNAKVIGMNVALRKILKDFRKEFHPKLIWWIGFNIHCNQIILSAP